MGLKRLLSTRKMADLAQGAGGGSSLGQWHGPAGCRLPSQGRSHDRSAFDCGAWVRVSVAVLASEGKREINPLPPLLNCGLVGSRARPALVPGGSGYRS